jgi:hypothetical protein
MVNGKMGQGGKGPKFEDVPVQPSVATGERKTNVGKTGQPQGKTVSDEHRPKRVGLSQPKQG